MKADRSLRSRLFEPPLRVSASRRLGVRSGLDDHRVTRRFVFNLACFLSLLTFVEMIPVWTISENTSWKRMYDGLQLTDRVSVDLVDGWIALFNQPMPFFDGTMSMSSGTTRPAWPKEVYLRFPGFHFRHFTWPGQFPGGTYWTLAISPGYVMLLSAILPVMWVNRRRLKRRNHNGLCEACGYDLTGNVSGVCPECGTVISRIA